ncbi:cytochrome P450 [Colletotrichum acutatum]|uniref:Cytochrome P450 n=1 Tax=Glomerella acutata TaxID=27357 RepID=A0AAD8XCP6_GLOAC|nr:cytochrome P450 [Colletotrichum acutatum]KAK1722412.1 cytochrome P450 [Colletotrichum acutatum]
MRALSVFSVLIMVQPIPGIPYNKHAAKSIFGDIPDIKRESPGNLLSWIAAQSRRHISPIFQVWLGPLTKPTVVIADFQEGQNILLRRKELDRSSFMSNVLSGEAKSFHITLKTGPQWKAQRRLLQDLKTPAFLHRVAAPNIYKTALDAVLDFGFVDAAPMRALIPEVELLVSMSAANVMAEQNSQHDSDRCIQGRMDRRNLEIPILQASERSKTQFRAVDNEEKHVKSTIDLMVRRLNSVMEKEGHLLPDWIETMRAEFIADDQAVQQRLFDSIRTFHIAASSEGRLPTHSEICDANIPYLDAVIEEMPRLDHTATSQDRECKEDTVILGHVIPKGTTVIVPYKGPSYTEPGYEIEERLRSPSSRKQPPILPDRWLVRDEKGNDEYNASAGPTLPFGLRLRGCFNRKLAYLEMKLLITLLIWSFEFQKCPENLSSYGGITTLTRKPVQCYERLKIR